MQIKNGLTVIAAKSIAASTITTKVAVKLAYQRISEIKVLIKYNYAETPLGLGIDMKKLFMTLKSWANTYLTVQEIIE